MYAIIQVGGKQFKVSVGDILYVEKLAEEEGSQVVFDALLVADGEKIQVGSPLVDGVKIVARVDGSAKGKKVIVYKFKPKKNYRRKQGHRQPYSKIEIVSIG